MSGVYCIKVNKAIVYVGKSKDINSRVRQHWRNILSDKCKDNKYSLLRMCGCRNDINITFWLLEEAEEDRIKGLETTWIKALSPCLNSLENGGKGKELTASEFYNIVMNNDDDVQDMQQYHYIKAEY